MLNMRLVKYFTIFRFCTFFLSDFSFRLSIFKLLLIGENTCPLDFISEYLSKIKEFYRKSNIKSWCECLLPNRLLIGLISKSKLGLNLETLSVALIIFLLAGERFGNLVLMNFLYAFWSFIISSSCDLQLP